MVVVYYTCQTKIISHLDTVGVLPFITHFGSYADHILRLTLIILGVTLITLGVTLIALALCIHIK